MNIIPALAAANDAPLMVKIIFWLLIIFCAIGGFAYRENQNVIRVNSIVILILFAILGYYTFGF